MKVKLIVEGGNMKPGPAVSQQLGPLGVNLGKIISDTNSATTNFKGMNVPIEIDVDPSSKEFTITVSSPSIAELLKKEVPIQKGSGDHKKAKVGNIAFEQVLKVAKTKMPDLLAKDLKAAIRLTLGTCASLGILVDSKEANEIQQDVQAGTLDAAIKSEKTEVSSDKKKELDAFFSDLKNQQDRAKKVADEAKAAAEAAKAESDAKAAKEKTDSDKDAKAPAKKK